MIQTMALEATHIRFALDLKNKYGVKDIEKYVAGSIYPDSRYVTEVDRMATHPENYKDWDMKRIDDFRKGWFAHLLADNIQWDITKELLPRVFEGSQGQGGERWIKYTAIKILQDLDDVKKFDISQYLPYLAHIENPNGEDMKRMKQYYDIFPLMYGRPNAVDIDSCYRMWKAFGINDELAAKVKSQAEGYSQDESIMDTILKIYPAMLLRANS
jgi:hypothetical protein